MVCGIPRKARSNRRYASKTLALLYTYAGVPYFSAIRESGTLSHSSVPLRNAWWGVYSVGSAGIVPGVSVRTGLGVKYAFGRQRSRSSSCARKSVFSSRYFTITGAYSDKPQSFPLPREIGRDPGTTTALSGTISG